MTKVFLGMSGGVDSSTAAVLLREQGYTVHGLHLSLLRGLPLSTEHPVEDGAAAAAAAAQLGIPFHDADLSGQFREAVISYFVRTYQEGQTPNPCVVCNCRIKFGAMWDTARAMGADCLATGHYAKIGRDRATGRYVLRRGADRAKDQSYFLCRLTQEQLSRTLFPLGTLTKPEVRRLAEAHGLVSAHKRDSQDICFIPDGDYAGFIDRCVGEASPTGPFLDEAGRVLGQHKGFVRYTKGQHKGLGLAIEPPLYVTKKDSATHAIYVGPSGALLTTELTAGEWNGIALAELTAPVTVSVKTRYSQREAEATAEPLLGGRFRLRFREPQRAVTPGQFAVLYDGEDVVGSGVILE